ncbi:hypothetical protein [Paraconexibacter sp. AEG42_29]
MIGRVGRRGAAALLPALIAGLASPLGTAGAAVPTYKDPPTIVAPTRAPQQQPPPTPPAVPLSTGGVFPDTLIDEAGTAHIIWTEGRGADADATVYCRLKRGTSSCDGAPVQLLWNKEYGPGDGPELNIDDLGPKIIRIGDQLVVLSHRYPTGSTKPDGTTSSDTVVAWVSSDGGQTWSDPSIVGRYQLGELGLIGTGDGVSILNFGNDPLCPGTCVEDLRSGEYSGAGGNLETGPGQGYHATMAVTKGIPTVAFADLQNQIFLRRWNGAGSAADPANWSVSAAVPGDEPSLAGGPAGVYMLSKAPSAPAGQRPPLVIRPVVDAAGGLAAGAATTVSTSDDVKYGRLAQDDQGRLLASWQQKEGAKPGVRLRVSDTTAPPASGARAALRQKQPAALPVGSDVVPAGIFGPAQTLLAGRDAGQIALAAARDGGGFAVMNRTGGVNQVGEIVATGFGTSVPTGLPGIADIPGGGTPTGKSCETIDFGSFDIKGLTCLYHGTGADAKKVSTRGEVDLFGLKFIPDVGSTLIIDPTKLRIDVVGQVKVLVRAPVIGDVVLWHGKLNVDLSAARPGSVLFDFPIGEYAANILGFSPAANIKVRLEKDGVHIPMSLKLPPAFFGASASTEFVADRATGLRLTSLRLKLGPVPLGAATLENFDLSYNPAQELWKGDGALSIAGAGRIAANTEFKAGQFNGATIKFDPDPPILIGPFVYLLRAGGGFTVDPLHIEVEGSVGGGAAIAGKSPVRVDGKLTADFPRDGPGKFAINGSVKLLDFEIATGRLRYQTDGYADFLVETRQDFAVLTLNGMFDGFVDGTTGDAAASFNGQACINFGVGCLVGAGLSGAVSSKGLAICGNASLGDLGDTIPKGPDGQPIVPPNATKGGGISMGVQFTLEGLKDAVSTLAATPPIAVPFVGAGIVLAHTHIPCHTGDFRVPPPRPRQVGAGVDLNVNVAGGLPSQTILVTGEEGLPAVDLVSGGTTLTGATAEQRGVQTPAGTSIAIPNANAVLFVLSAPKAGTWTVTPRAGSPAVKSIQLSDGYRVARPTGVVRKAGRLRSLAYRVADLAAGQQVRFVETGTFGTRILGSATRPAGTLRLPAGALPGGPRTITAEIMKDGLTTDRKVVARYVAPRPPGPAAVSGLAVIRKGTTLTVTWRRASLGAARQLVKLTGAKGTRLLSLVGPTTRVARFSGVRADERVTVEVAGVTRTNVRGTVQRKVSAGARIKR